MDYKFFFKEIKNIIFDPAKVWESTDSKNKSEKLVRDSFFFPLIIIVTVSGFTGSLIFSNSELAPLYSIFAGLKCFGIFYFTIYATSYIFSEITYPLDLGKDFSISFRITVYSAAPFLMCQILSRLFESLLFVNIVALYGLYIFWIGIEKLLDPPQYKKVPLLIAVTVTLVGTYIVTDLVLSMIIDRVYFAFLA